jgi:dihydrofolate synthase/folylpolyglutamate synthase
MNYKEALEYIHGTRKFGSKLGLENIRILLELLGNPHKELKIIHIAGTNGKGSTSSFISSILKEARYNVGLFTSPYLEKFTERIRINEECISEEDLARITSTVKENVEKMIENGYNHPTEFEIVTAIAFVYYYQKKVDYVVLEVGLGGRYDSTNIIDKSIASVITPISMDHMDILGDSINKIAWEKAGIIKDNGLVICFPQEQEAQDVIERVVKEKKGELITVPIDNISLTEIGPTGSRFNFSYNTKTFEDLQINLLGSHQVFNASIALTTILVLKEKGLVDVTDYSIINGLRKAQWKGRLEILKEKPSFIIDGAHNLQGAQALRNSIKNLFKFNKLILGIGILGDKDVEKIVKELVTIADAIVITEANNPRALKAEELAKIVSKYNNNYFIEKDIEKAVEKALNISDKEDLIVFSGSLYLIGDIRRIILNR